MPQNYLIRYQKDTIQYIAARSSTAVMTNVVQPLNTLNSTTLAKTVKTTPGWMDGCYSGFLYSMLRTFYL